MILAIYFLVLFSHLSEVILCCHTFANIVLFFTSLRKVTTFNCLIQSFVSIQIKFEMENIEPICCFAETGGHCSGPIEPRTKVNSGVVSYINKNSGFNSFENV